MNRNSTHAQETGPGRLGQPGSADCSTHYLMLHLLEPLWPVALEPGLISNTVVTGAPGVSYYQSALTLQVQPHCLQNAFGRGLTQREALSPLSTEKV